MPGPLEVYVDPGSGSDVTGDGSIGNPYASVQHAFDSTTHGADGTRYNIKAGAADVTGNTALTLQNSTPDAPLWLQGYTAVAGDGGKGQIDAGFAPLLQGGYNYIHIHDLEISTNAVSVGIYSSIVNCILAGDVNLSSSYGKALGNQIVGTVAGNTGADVRHNKIIHNSGYAISFTGQSVAAHNVIVSQSGATGGIELRGNDNEAVNNSLYADSTVAYGIRCTSARYVVGAYNNLLQGYTTALSSVTNVNKTSMWCNSSFGHTTLEDFLQEEWYMSSFVNNSLSESPFTNAAAGDFTPKNITNVSTGFGAIAAFRGALSPASGGGGGSAGFTGVRGVSKRLGT